MRTSNRKLVAVLFTLILMLGYVKPKYVKAENSISLSSLGVAYIQDFNSLASTGESNVLPVGWAMLETGTLANGAYLASRGNLTNPDTYSYGSTDSTDRALGSIHGDDLVPMIGASFTNNTGGTILSLDIGYTGEEWYLGRTGRKDRFVFEISMNATSLNNGEWNTFTDLEFLTPNTQTLGAKDGNSSLNRTSLFTTINGLNIENGKTFWVRWRDNNSTYADGKDDGLAVDDFSIIPSGSDNAPSVVSVLPSTGSSSVTLDANLVVEFSEPVLLSTDWFTLSCQKSGDHPAQISGGPTTYTLDPNTSFDHEESCSFTINAGKVSDLDDTDPPDGLLSNFSSSFTTKAAPESAPIVTSISPSNNDENIALYEPIIISFSEPVQFNPNWYSISCSISGIHSAVVSGGLTTYILTPTQPYIYDENCTITIFAQGVTDVDSYDPPDNLPSDYSTSFSTQNSPDTAPYILSSTPSNGDTSVDPKQEVTITFNEEVTINNGGVELICDDSGNHFLTVSGGPTVFKINKVNDFSYSEHCELRINAQHIHDQDTEDPPDTMSMEQVIGFTISDPFDSAPFIVESIPEQDTVNVSIHSPISITFNEEVATIGDWVSLDCEESGNHTLTIEGNSITKTLIPENAFAFEEICTLVVSAENVLDSDSYDPPDEMDADFILNFTTASPTDSAPTILKTVPADGAIDVPISGPLTVIFSEPVSLRTGWIDFNCSKSGHHDVALEKGPIEYSFGAMRDFSYSETCTVIFKAESIEDQDLDDPPDRMKSDYFFTFTTEIDPDSLTYPIIVFDNNSFPREGQVLPNGFHHLLIKFSKDVIHDGSDDAVDNPINYRLFTHGKDHIFETDTCDLMKGDDIQISIDQISYDPITYLADLSVNNANNLKNGVYRLIVCGANTIRDLFGNPLNNGENSTITFSVSIPDDGGDGGEDGGDDIDDEENSENIEDEFNTTPMIPVTGFSKHGVTDLIKQNSSYADFGELWLEIPSMDLKISITGVPEQNGNWDVSWLNQQAGWLEGSAFPTFNGNSVLTAHVWDALNQPGPFYGLEKLKFGEQVTVHAWGDVHIYEVREVLSVDPANVTAMLKHQEEPWLTLVTCRGYDEEEDVYLRRTLVRAVLIEIRD